MWCGVVWCGVIVMDDYVVVVSLVWKVFEFLINLKTTNKFNFKLKINNNNNTLTI